MVTCMAGRCDEVTGSWYWIYYVAPFFASYCVAELTLIMDMDVGEATEEPLLESAKESPEADALKSVDVA